MFPSIQVFVFCLVQPTIIYNPISIYFEKFLENSLQAVFRCDAYGIPTPEVNWKKVTGNPKNCVYLECGINIAFIGRYQAESIEPHVCDGNTLAEVTCGETE